MTGFFVSLCTAKWAQLVVLWHASCKPATPSQTGVPFPLSAGYSCTYNHSYIHVYTFGPENAPTPPFSPLDAARLQKFLGADFEGDGPRLSRQDICGLWTRNAVFVQRGNLFFLLEMESIDTSLLYALYGGVPFSPFILFVSFRPWHGGPRIRKDKLLEAPSIFHALSPNLVIAPCTT
jgi:hypothetical protein